MYELERWYDVEIVYEKETPKIELKGKLTRDVPLTDLLSMFEKIRYTFSHRGPEADHFVLQINALSESLFLTVF